MIAGFAGIGSIAGKIYSDAKKTKKAFLELLDILNTANADGTVNQTEFDAIMVKVNALVTCGKALYDDIDKLKAEILAIMPKKA